MKSYFLFETPPAPGSFTPKGFYHWMSLPGGGYVAVVQDENAVVPSDWTALPHLLEPQAANFNGITITAGTYAAAAGKGPAPASLAGIATTDNTFQIATKLAAINRHFRP